MLRARFLACVLLALAPTLSACVGNEPTIALLVADGSDTTSRAVDVERFTDRVEATCDECRVTVYDAKGDADTQKSQARQAEASSAEVVVVVAVDPDGLATLTSSELPVVSLGELVPGSDRFVGLRDGTKPVQAGTDLAAARRVLLGEEKSMLYVPTAAMSEQAADLAVAYLADTSVAGGQPIGDVEAWLFDDRNLTVDSLTTALVVDGVVTVDELCAGETAKECVRFGLR